MFRFSHCSSQKLMQKIDISLPQEEQPVEMVDRREEHPAETAARREKQPAGMANRQGQGEPKPVDIPEITPHFFKIILSPHASKLHIPNEFVTEHGANLGDIVLLEVPNGVVWKIKLLNSSGMVWLNEGWNKFKEYYSIACGYFLLFRYKGNSQFSVFIFDLSASEIEYPPGPNEDMTPENRSVLCVPPEENRINLPPPGEPPKENRANLTPPDDPPEEDVIYLPPPGIYTMEELSLSSMPSRPKV
ncbi:B3 domain-containing protein At3g18960-like isoform X1 [Solanum stenotomum]|uniref:B3 domain-containing protein At3g18960-like isoform X1 n=3 Tax=Solanum stenotomum TaxID=172797 RepID=UPI0020D18C2F|nr:B3 domain-containing protein At3g18960-like isoform X1 [Solanum stenotomum]